MSRLRPVDGRPCLFDRVVGTGGVGWGISFLLEENRALGREESRLAHLRDARDYCKLHIIAHYLAVLLGAPRAGITVHPVGRVGDDQPGRRLRDELRSAGACLEHLGVATGAQTLFSTCLQYPDGSGGNITSSNSASGLVDASDIDDAFASACLRVPGRTLALAVPEVPLAARLRLLELGRSTGAFTAASFTATEAAAFVAAGGPRLADLVAINAEEAAALVGGTTPRADDQVGKLRLLSRCAKALAGANPALRLVVSFGSGGCVGWEGGTARSRSAIETTVASTAGAGDALFAGVLAGLACGLPFLPEGDDSAALAGALDLGTLLASFSVTSPHSIHPDASAAALRRHAIAHRAALSPEMAAVLGGG